MNQDTELVVADCRFCDVLVKVPISAKTFICPRCGGHNEFDEHKKSKSLEFLLNVAGDDEPKKPGNN